MAHWLIKSEPSVYSWSDFTTEKTTFWSGIRNYAARLHLLSMKIGDEAFFYHSNEGMEIVGIARVMREASPDPTTDDPRWVGVEFKAMKPLKKRVSLAMMKADKRLSNMALIRISRLSVSPVSDEEWKVIMELSEKK